MHPQIETITVVTDTEGAGIGYTSSIWGQILAVEYVKPGSGGYSDGVGFTVTLESTGQTVLAKSSNSSFISRPRALVQEAADGTDTTVYEPLYSAGERVKVAVAAGGSTNTGTFVITYA